MLRPGEASGTVASSPENQRPERVIGGSPATKPTHTPQRAAPGRKYAGGRRVTPGAEPRTLPAMKKYGNLLTGYTKKKKQAS